MMNDESSWKLTQAHMDLHGELKLSCGPEKKKTLSFSVPEKNDILKITSLKQTFIQPRKKLSCCTIFNTSPNVPKCHFFTKILLF